MRNLRFEINKIKNEIKTHGNKYNIERYKTNEYGEPTNERYIVLSNISGLFHISKGYISDIQMEGTQTHSKGQPMLMVVYENNNVSKIYKNDIIQINDNIYKVIEKNDIQMFGIVCDISLELVVSDAN